MQMVHVTIQTQYLEKSIEFYQTVLRLNIIRRMKNSNQRIVFLADSKEDTCIELVENLNESYNGSGISLGFATNNIQNLYDQLSNQNINLSKIISPNPHTQFFFTQDPNGVKIQFIQQKK